MASLVKAKSFTVILAVTAGVIAVLLVLVSLPGGAQRIRERAPQENWRAAPTSELALHLPSPPAWLTNAPAPPEWWPRVESGYDDNAEISNRWATLKSIERRISQAVRTGASPSEDRQRLIKYLTVFSQAYDLESSSARRGLTTEIAQIYDELGDYRTAAAKRFEIVTAHPEYEFSLQFSLHSLAIDYERLGETNSALQIYDFMIQTFKRGTIGEDIGKTWAACLRGVTNDFRLQRPEWWDQYASPPEWLSNSPVRLPTLTCFRDGFDYIPYGMRKNQDQLKAWMSLLEFTPITHNEQVLTLVAAAGAYSKMGDHHRAIECAWQVPEKFSGDISGSTNALRFIASEFEKLGEPQHAEEIRRSITRSGW